MHKRAGRENEESSGLKKKINNREENLALPKDFTAGLK